MNVNLNETIIKNVGCDKFKACLELCGCDETFDLRSLNEGDINNMEKYISVTCQSMEKDKRKRYMREEFVNNPEKFILSPIVKKRFFTTIEKVTDEIDKSTMDNVSQENVICVRINPENNTDCKPPDNSVTTIQDLKVEENAKDKDSNHSLQINRISVQNSINECSISYKGKMLQNITECDDDEYEYIIKKTEMFFKECHLVKNKDFSIYRDMKEDYKGYFSCNLCFNFTKKYRIITFIFLKHNNIDLNAIKKHLALHFQYLEEPKRRSLKRINSMIDKVQGKRKRISFRNDEVNDNLSEESQHEKENASETIDVGVVKVESGSRSSMVYDAEEDILIYKRELLKDLSECAEQYYEFVIKESKITFQNCNLVKNKHFNLYQDNKDPSKGYYRCRVCENKMLKFNFIKNVRMYFWSIKSHLKLHFQVNELLKKGTDKDNQSYEESEES